MVTVRGWLRQMHTSNKAHHAHAASTFAVPYDSMLCSDQKAVVYRGLSQYAARTRRRTTAHVQHRVQASALRPKAPARRNCRNQKAAPALQYVPNHAPKLEHAFPCTRAHMHTHTHTAPEHLQHFGFSVLHPSSNISNLRTC